VDCIVRKQSEYRLTIHRRQRIKIENFETWIVSKEDLVPQNCFWAKDSRSELQLRDVKNLVSTGSTRYIERWTRALDLVICGKKFCMNDTPPEIAELVRQKLMRALARNDCHRRKKFDAARAVVLASLPANSSPGRFETSTFQSSMASQRRSEWRATFRCISHFAVQHLRSASLR